MTFIDCKDPFLQAYNSPSQYLFSCSFTTALLECDSSVFQTFTFLDYPRLQESLTTLSSTIHIFSFFRAVFHRFSSSYTKEFFRPELFSAFCTQYRTRKMFEHHQIDLHSFLLFLKPAIYSSLPTVRHYFLLLSS